VPFLSFTWIFPLGDYDVMCVFVCVCVCVCECVCVCPLHSHSFFRRGVFVVHVSLCRVVGLLGSRGDR
jgi:hypothetical protein